MHDDLIYHSELIRESINIGFSVVSGGFGLLADAQQVYLQTKNVTLCLHVMHLLYKT